MFKLVEELRVEDTATYKEMLRVNCETFEEILTAIGPVITKHQVVGGHRVISPATRQTLMLQFLATGKHFALCTFNFTWANRPSLTLFVRYVKQCI